MFISFRDRELKLLLKHPFFWMLFINSFLVIFAYGINTLTNGASQDMIQKFKTAVLLLSFVYVLAKGKIRFYSYTRINKTVFFFTYFLLLSSLSAGDIAYSLSTALKFIVPFFYIFFSMQFLLRKFSVQTVLRGILMALILIYSIPVLTFIITGQGFSQVNIYGNTDDSDQAFASNHYGWASILFILCSIVTYSTTRLSYGARIFMIILLPISFYLLIISANRTSWLALLLAFVYLLLKGTKVKGRYLLISLILVITFLFTLVDIPGSAINFVIEKSQGQQQTGEARFIVANFMFDYFNHHKSLWLTGVGFFNHAHLSNLRTNLSGYHNSYYEVLFGCGIPVFLIFIYFSFLRPIYVFYKNYATFFPILIPILLIPFFESNFTAGQFLFFPWFIIVCLAGAKTGPTPEQGLPEQRL